MEIKTSARLHMSLIDLNGSENRIDGGVGLTLDEPSLLLECIPNNKETTVTCAKNIPQIQEYADKILKSYQMMCNYLKIDTTYTFNIKKIYPIHHGLGLGTRLALATAKLIAKMNNINISTYELACIINRGGTSGIGVYSFSQGGFIIDGGHKKDVKSNFLPSSSSKVAPPPLIARYEFPTKWKIILATPKSDMGANGSNEVDIFQKYTPIPKKDVNEICYQILMNLMPSIVEYDLDSFAKSINKIQTLGFKKIERNLQDIQLKEVIDTMQNQGCAAGMSSFGPTCFGITDTNTKSIKRQLKNIMGEDADIIITKAKNKGYEIK